MHIAARVGIAAATAGAVGFGAHKLVTHGAERTRREHAELDRQVAEQGAAWDAWSAKLEQEFPGRRLDTPADHARFDAFLRDNPAPSWVGVEHEDYTRARLTITGPIVDKDLFPMPEREKAIGYGVVGMLGMLGMGGAALVSGLRGGGSPLAIAGKVAGGAAAVAAGAGMIGLTVSDIRLGTNMDGYRELRSRVQQSMA